MRICPINHCECLVPDHKFSCYPHWQLFTWKERNEIHAAYGQYCHGDIDLARLLLRQAAVVALVEARIRRDLGATAT